ncbi:FimV/HubP family polar landmark protein [Rhodanobacter sp. DHB23]|uniref:FimV/HubP family polar landmark protein n=1 Tax=Rhodanobacter sp. DHB23 TaxID=2775923 RepID=UPI001780F7F4|nr:FimV/HubP family polar landmark protein [Rhodanobacter sp. DHB23]MBD8871641.1 fimbrial protein FimV [Rhodanobacter sp. DHB23]
MNRSLKLPLLVALALGSGHALAMDLGQIQVKSALGQPLLAEIPVQQATPAELQQLNVQLASGDASGGIPLHFAVVDGSNGRKVIRITSETAVNDPFLDLLVEIHGSSGKSVREFTILLDPPGSTPAPSPTQVARAAKPAAAPRPASSVGIAAPAQAANGRWTVERGQTLSTVAHQTAPSGVDVNQMLLALKQANPDAFYRDNINALKAGAVLRIPAKAEAEAIAIATAAAEVRRQNGDWRSGTVGNAPTSVADAGMRAGASSSPTANGATGDRLALVPAKQGSKSATDNSEALRQDLQRSKETLANLQQQGDDLKSRLKDLSDINNKNQRLLALKDSEIAELQQKLAAARKTASAPVEPAHAATAATAMAVATPKPVAAASAAPALPASASSSASAGKQAATPANAATAPAVGKPEPTATPAKAEPAKATPAKPVAARPAPAGDEPWYSQLWVQVLGGVAVLLLLVWALLGRRKAKPAASLPKVTPSLADRFGAEPSHGDEDDVDQNLLLDQLAEHPDDVGLHLELVSLYYGRRDIDHFEAAAEAMYAHVSDPQQEEWQQVVRMGEDLVPGHPLFARHDAASTEEQEARHGFDIDRYAAEPVAAPAPAGPPPMPANPVKVSEYNFNFDLTPAHEPAAKHADEAEPAAEPPHVADEDATVVKSWQFDEPETELQPAGHDIESREFSDDPVDTKLDLARAYLDMGDPEGARAMLEEVIHEGSQMQRDVARRLLDDLH